MKNRLLLLLIFSSLPFMMVAQDKLGVLSYNVLKGFQADTAYQQMYIDWVKDLSPDIIAYQEMNDFTQKKLEEFAKKYNHPYAVLSKTDGFPVALSSKFPIVKVEKVVDNMWHSYIYANINKIHVFVIHFSPFSYQKRQFEVSEILARAALLPQNEPIMIMGDFNSLSVDDSLQYDSNFLASELAAEKKRQILRNLNNGKLDFTVTNEMKKAGFIDAQYFKEDKFSHSIPTKKYAHNKLKRIDYIWVNDVLAKDLTKSEIIYNKVTDTISDHYPVYIELKTK